jgi:hypothetical protein
MLSFLRNLTRGWPPGNADRDLGPPPLAPTPLMTPEDKILIGLDVGQVRDPTALNALQMTRTKDENGRTRRHYTSRLLYRWPLHTGYETIIENVREIAANLPAPPELILDATGAGRPVAQMFRAAKLLLKCFVPVIITGGKKVIQEEDGYWHVAKSELVSCVLAVSQSRRLTLSTKLREAKTLVKELQKFRSKININTGNESFEAWREKDHDDLVFATALALWRGEHFYRRLGGEHFFV